MHIEKKGKILAFLKAKSKPLKPRAPKSKFELKTSLSNFRKKLKVDPHQQPPPMAPAPGMSQEAFAA